MMGAVTGRKRGVVPAEVCALSRALFLTTAAPIVTAAQEADREFAGQGLESSLEHISPWPPWITILLVVAAAVFAFGVYWREQSPPHKLTKFSLATIRFAVMCLVIWMMYGFTVRPFHTDLPDLLLVVDDSQSMATVDGQSDRATIDPDNKATEVTRLDQAKSILLGHDRLLNLLREDYQLKFATVQSPAARSAGDLSQLKATIQAVEATGARSPLGTTLEQLLQRQRGRPVAAVVMFTDGITTEGQPLSEVATNAKQRHVPLHLIGLGSQRPTRDLRLSDLLVDNVVFLGDLVTFDVTLHSIGFAGETVEVTLKRAGEPEPVMRQQVRLTKGRESMPIRLAFRAAQEGTIEFEIEATANENEASTDNNALSAQVEIRDEQMRVLLVQSYPSYEFHYLKTLLSREQDESGSVSRRPVELDVLLQDADPEFADIDGTALRSFPSRDELFPVRRVYLWRCESEFSQQSDAGESEGLRPEARTRLDWHRGTPLFPHGLRGHSATGAPSVRRRFRTSTAGRAADPTGISSPADAAGRASAIDAALSRGECQPQGMVGTSRTLLVAGNWAAEARRPRLERTPDKDWHHRAPVARDDDVLRGRRQGALSRRRWLVAMAHRTRRRPLRTILAPVHPVP